MTRYKVSVDKDALNDIQQATDWYNEQIGGLGKRFQRQIKIQVNGLKFYPKIHQVRFADVRCALVKKFPFLIHYSINEKKKIVEVLGVFHTSRNPEIWMERLNKLK